MPLLSWLTHLSLPEFGRFPDPGASKPFLSHPPFTMDACQHGLEGSHALRRMTRRRKRLRFVVSVNFVVEARTDDEATDIVRRTLPGSLEANLIDVFAEDSDQR